MTNNEEREFFPVSTISFLNGDVIVGTMVSYTEGEDEHIEENKKMGMADVFFIRFVEHPESRERNAYFIPVLKGQENQFLHEEEVKNLLEGTGVIQIGLAPEGIKKPYMVFIGDRDRVRLVTQRYCTECGPSKEFVRQLLLDDAPTCVEPKEVDGVVYGVFAREPGTVNKLF